MQTQDLKDYLLTKLKSVQTNEATYLKDLIIENSLLIFLMWLLGLSMIGIIINFIMVLLLKLIKMLINFRLNIILLNME